MSSFRRKNTTWLTSTTSSDKDMRMCYIATCKHNGKAATKTNHALAKANKMADSCAIKFDVNSVVLPRGYSTENLRYARYRVNHSNDTIAAHIRAELLVNCSAVVSVLLLLRTLTMDEGRNFKRNPQST